MAQTHPDADELTQADPRSAAPAEDLTLPPRYQKATLIGRGGMGVVLRVWDVSLHRPLAVKLMLARQASASMAERFLAEARITGQLQHPGIPPVHEIGQLADGRPFFSMKLIEGRTLYDLLHDRAAPADDLPRYLQIFEQVAQTVGYAHAQGILHRDLKPRNIMVGAFGEVQVMDWGLAKRRADSGPWPRPPQADPTELLTDAAQPTAETEAQTPDTPGPLTQAGAVLGTLAFMSPEQARGETERVDERSDVFGLGSILCQVLTGRPPYVGTDREDVYRRARSADLTDSFVALAASGADPELIDLARSLLAADQAARPANGGAVAERMTVYLHSVQERLRRAELERAAAQVKTAEQRKRRRWQLAATAALLVLAVGGSATWLWYRQEQTRRDAQLQARGEQVQTNVEEHLASAERVRQEIDDTLGHPLRVAGYLSRIDGWKQRLDVARASVDQARDLVASNPDVVDAALLERVRGAQAWLAERVGDWQTAQELDEGRLAGLVTAVRWSRDHEAGRFRQVFDRLGLDVRAAPAEVAERIKTMRLRYVLVATLDAWADPLPAESAAPLLEIARLADPDPWRDRARNPQVTSNADALKALAREANLAEQTPHLLSYLGGQLNLVGGPWAPFLRAAAQAHPQDFWLHFRLGNFLNNSGAAAEAAGSYRAALAIRPRSAPALNNLGLMLRALRDEDTADACFRAAIAANPQLVEAHVELGQQLLRHKDYDGAARSLERAIQVGPDFARAYEAMAVFHKDREDWQGALSYMRKAVDLEPDNPSFQVHLGNILWKTGDPAAADHHYQRAAKGDYPAAYLALAHVARVNHHPDQVIAQVRKALRLKPDYVEALTLLGDTLAAQGETEAAYECSRKALAIDPNDADACYNIGTSLQRQGNLDEAVRLLRRAVAGRPEWAEANCNLGHALRNDGQFVEALRYLERGHELGSKRPDWHYDSDQWVQTCRAMIAMDERAPAMLRGEVQLTDIPEWSRMFQLCDMKHTPATQARLWQQALAARVPAAQDLGNRLRLQALRAAALAGTGQGREPLTAPERAALRQLAREWLRADLAAWQQRCATNDPAATVAFHQVLLDWKAQPELAPLRDEQQLARLPVEEAQAWRQWWQALEPLRQQVASRFRETRLTGVLSPSERTRLHEVQWSAGTTYVIDLESTAFDPLLQLQGASGKLLAEHNDLAPNNLNARLVFTAPREGTYRLVAAMALPGSQGTYALTIRAFAAAAHE